MEFKDYYKILGVEKDAAMEAIKKAYRKQARKYHPDVSKETDSEVRMKEVNEAYEVLSDAERRVAYDSLARGHRSGEAFRPPPDWDAGFEFSGGTGRDAQAEDYSDFFANLFGRSSYGRSTGQHRQHGEDHHAKIVIDLADAYHGTSRSVTLRAARVDARGQVVTEDRTLNVQIPRGIKEGQQIRLAGQGSSGIGHGLAGDLYLEVHFSTDPRYRVQERDVYQRLPVTPWEAALGGDIEVPTPSGTVQVSVPPRSKSGRKLRLRERGIPGTPAGDLYLDIEVAWPPGDTERSREFYKAMAREMPFNPRHNPS